MSEDPPNLGVQVTVATPLSVHHHMAVNLDTMVRTLQLLMRYLKMMLFIHWNVTCQCGTEDDVIHSLECDLSVWN